MKQNIWIVSVIAALSFGRTLSSQRDLQPFPLMTRATMLSRESNANFGLIYFMR